MRNTGKEMIIPDQSGFFQDKFPVVEAVRSGGTGVSAQQGQAERASIIYIGGKIYEVFTKPPQAKRGSKGISHLKQKSNQAN